MVVGSPTSRRIRTANLQWPLSIRAVPCVPTGPGTRLVPGWPPPRTATSGRSSVSNAVTPMDQLTANLIERERSGVLTRPDTRPSTLPNATLRKRIRSDRCVLRQGDRSRTGRSCTAEGLTGLPPFAVSCRPRVTPSFGRSRPEMTGAGPHCPAPIISPTHRRLCQSSPMSHRAGRTEHAQLQDNADCLWPPRAVGVLGHQHLAPAPALSTAPATHEHPDLGPFSRNAGSPESRGRRVRLVRRGWDGSSPVRATRG